MVLGTFNTSVTANQTTILGIIQTTNAATAGILMNVVVLALYFILFVVIKERMPDIKQTLLAVSTIMVFLVIFLFWLQFVAQTTLTISIVLFALSIILAMWRE